MGKLKNYIFLFITVFFIAFSVNAYDEVIGVVSNNYSDLEETYYYGEDIKANNEYSYENNTISMNTSAKLKYLKTSIIDDIIPTLNCKGNNYIETIEVDKLNLICSGSLTLKSYIENGEVKTIDEDYIRDHLLTDVDYTFNEDETVTFGTKVNYPVTSIKLNKTSLTLEKGKSYSLIATLYPNYTTDDKTVTWSSSNTKIATVSNGKVVAKGIGKAYITAKSKNGKYVRILVTVTKVKASSLTYSTIANKTYTGKSIKPGITVKYGSIVLRKGIDYTVSYGTNRNIGKGSVKITLRGVYTGTKTIGFNILPKKVTIKSISSPTAGAFKVTYTSSPAISGYQIAYRVKGTSTLSYKVTKSLSKTVTGLKYNQVYDVYVRAYKTVSGKNYYSGWTAVKNVRIKMTTTQTNAVNKAKSLLTYGEYSKLRLIEMLEYYGYSNAMSVFAASNAGANYNTEALQSASSYIKYSDFSEIRLREQLEYEKFTESEINYAMTHLVVNWNQEALDSARNYLKYSSFSENELREQLEYEKFTPEQIEYAMAGLVSDWNQEALESAQSYLKYSSFSESELRSQLEYEGFTPSQINYAMTHIVVDWNEEALESARSYMKYFSFSESELRSQLEYEGFTPSQINYAIANM